MGCGASLRPEPSTLEDINYRGIVPEENFRAKAATQPILNSNDVPQSNERTETLSEGIPQEATKVDTRNINFTSGLIFTEALVPENADTESYLTTSLFRMIKKGELDSIQQLLSNHYADNQNQYYLVHNLKGMWNSSPLMVAIQYSQKEIVEYFLSLLPLSTNLSSLQDLSAETSSVIEVTLNEKNDKGGTILHYATVEGMTWLVEKLLSPPFLPFVEKDLLQRPTTEPIYNAQYDQSLICSPLSIAIMNGSVEVFRLFVSRGKCSISDPFPFFVAKNNQKRLLLGNRTSSNGNSKGSSQTSNGVTPLMLAISFGQVAIVEEIISHSLETRSLLPAIFSVKDVEGWTAIHYLCRLTAKQSHRDENDSNFLGESSHFLNVDIIQLLRKHHLLSKSLINEKDLTGAPPLYISCEQKQLAMVRLLLEEGANPSVFNDSSGLTPLHIAVKKRSTEIVACLLEFGADPLLKHPSLPNAQAAVEFSRQQLKESHEIYSLLEQAAQTRHATRNTLEEENTSKQEEDHEEKVEDTPQLLQSEKEAEIRNGTVVEDFVPLEESFVCPTTEKGSSQHRSMDLLLATIPQLQSIPSSSSLPPEQTIPSPSQSSLPQPNQQLLIESFLSDDSEGIDAEEELRGAESISPLSEPKPESQRQSRSVSPIQAYMETVIVAESPRLTKEERKKREEEEENFSEFIDGLLGKGATEILQNAEQSRPKTASTSPTKEATQSAPPKPAKSPRRPQPPVQPKNNEERKSFQGRRKSSLASNKSRRTIVKTPSSASPSKPSVAVSNENPYLTPSTPLAPTSPRTRKPSLSEEVRPVRRGTVIKKRGNSVSAPPSQPLPQPSKQSTANGNLAEIVASTAIAMDKDRESGEVNGSLVKRGYDLAEKIKSLTVSSFENDDHLSSLDQPVIDIETLFIGTRPALSVAKGRQDEEKTVRIKR